MYHGEIEMRDFKLVGYNPSLQEYEECDGGDCGWHTNHLPASLEDSVKLRDAILRGEVSSSELVLEDEYGDQSE
jgi:hypothetical protein